MNSKTILKHEIELLYQNILEHPATNHSAFKLIVNLAQTSLLHAHHFNIFRTFIFSRVFLTIPSICESIKQNILRGELKAAKTAFQNLVEEMSFSKNGKDFTHVELMQNSFNFIGERIFNLPCVTPLEEFCNIRFQEIVIYQSLVKELYRSYPNIISFAQEVSSGGDNSEQHPGMMASMYQAFYSIFHANQHIVSKINFSEEVLPYFKAHIVLDERFRIKQDTQGVEYQHGQRAKVDFIESINSTEELLLSKTLILSFLDAQNNLFDRLEKELNTLTQNSLKTSVG
ncbi:MAG: hypothetical protein KBC84_06570 [Proteobacteria bacterium]|nr:hypothetical protein [Pseudomonadota bacterium]